MLGHNPPFTFALYFEYWEHTAADTAELRGPVSLRAKKPTSDVCVGGGAVPPNVYVRVTAANWFGETASASVQHAAVSAGQVLDSMLSEHQCEGWLEGYLLTGRHGVFNSYEAFIHKVDCGAEA